MTTDATIEIERSDMAPAAGHTARSIQDDIERKIASGAWLTGSKLPSRRQMASNYGVALATIERACSKLLADGVLVADGRGTQVGDRSISPLDLASDERIRTPAQSDLSLHGATVGLIDCFALYPTDGSRDGSEWTQGVISAFEASIYRMRGSVRICGKATLGRGDFVLSSAMDWLVASGVDAVCLVGLHGFSGPLTECLGQVNVPETPIVCVTSYDMHLPVFGVHFDNWTAGYQSASHLVQAGYAGLWFLGPSDQPWAVDRLAGAKAAANGRGADIQPLLGDQTYGIWPNVTRIREQTIELLDGFNPSAGFGVVAANDTTAATVSAVLRERGLSAGVDYGLVGFDNSPDSRRNDITTFRPPLEELGTEASRILAVALSGDTRQQRIGLRGQLIARSSTSPYHSR